MTLKTRSETQRRTRDPRRSLAERKHGVTREAIMAAFVQAMLEVGIDCSMQDVAERAGVTQRTIYRYFASREALLDAVSRWYDHRFEAAGALEPRSLHELPESAEHLFHALELHSDLSRAAAVMALTRNEQPRSRLERTGRLRALLEGALPHLPPEELNAAFAVIRTLAGATGWYQLASQFGLTGEQSGPAVRRALEAIIADLTKRDAEIATSTEEARE